MSGTKYSLTQQLQALDMLAQAAPTVFRKKCKSQSQADYMVQALTAARNTLAFMQTHEFTIKDAIRAARALDAETRETVSR